MGLSLPEHRVLHCQLPLPPPLLSLCSLSCCCGHFSLLSQHRALCQRPFPVAKSSGVRSLQLESWVCVRCVFAIGHFGVAPAARRQMVGRAGTAARGQHPPAFPPCSNGLLLRGRPAERWAWPLPHRHMGPNPTPGHTGACDSLGSHQRGNGQEYP